MEVFFCGNIPQLRVLDVLFDLGGNGYEMDQVSVLTNLHSAFSCLQYPKTLFTATGCLVGCSQHVICQDAENSELSSNSPGNFMRCHPLHHTSHTGFFALWNELCQIEVGSNVLNLLVKAIDCMKKQAPDRLQLNLVSLVGEPPQLSRNCVNIGVGGSVQGWPMFPLTPGPLFRTPRAPAVHRRQIIPWASPVEAEGNRGPRRDPCLGFKTF